MAEFRAMESSTLRYKQQLLDEHILPENLTDVRDCEILQVSWND